MSNTRLGPHDHHVSHSYPGPADPRPHLSSTRGGHRQTVAPGPAATGQRQRQPARFLATTRHFLRIYRFTPRPPPPPTPQLMHRRNIPSSVTPRDSCTRTTATGVYGPSLPMRGRMQQPFPRRGYSVLPWTLLIDRNSLIRSIPPRDSCKSVWGLCTGSTQEWGPPLPLVETHYLPDLPLLRAATSQTPATSPPQPPQQQPPLAGVDRRRRSHHGPAIPAAGAVRGSAAEGAPPAGALGDVHPAARCRPAARPGRRVRILRPRLPFPLRRLPRGVRPDPASSPAGAAAGGAAAAWGCTPEEPLPRRRVLRWPRVPGRRRGWWCWEWE